MNDPQRSSVQAHRRLIDGEGLLLPEFLFGWLIELLIGLTPRQIEWVADNRVPEGP